MLGNPREKAPEAQNCLNVYAQYVAWHNVSIQPPPADMEDVRALYEEERARVFLEMYVSMVFGKKYFGAKRSGRERWFLARDGAVDRW
ncbi:Copper amine oxidase 1 [Venturia inaequalis]|nr:Copper amine oxidase 1 [Venturia inaequalis]